MQLVGMLDSPYVRRVAVALLHARAPFTHRPISLFRHIEAFSAVSPMLKAPTLILDDGAALVESSVILECLAADLPAVAALRPRDAPAFQALGAALTVMEKAVQIHYERALRAPGERSESWRERVTGQLRAGLAALEPWARGQGREDIGHAGIAAACAYAFVKDMVAGVVAIDDYPGLAALSARAEASPAFLAAPAKDGVTARSFA